MSKLRYGLAAFGTPRLSDTDPLTDTMSHLQKKQNEVLRVISGTRRTDRKSVTNLLMESKMVSVNRMAAETILKETWNIMNSEDSELRSEMCHKTNLSEVHTRAKHNGLLELTRSMPSFAYRGAKLWNWAPKEVKEAQSKYTLKSEVKKVLKHIPL